MDQALSVTLQCFYFPEKLTYRVIKELPLNRDSVLILPSLTEVCRKSITETRQVQRCLLPSVSSWLLAVSTLSELSLCILQRIPVLKLPLCNFNRCSPSTLQKLVNTCFAHSILLVSLYLLSLNLPVSQKC